MKKLIYIIHSIQIGGAEVALLSSIPKLVENFNLTLIVIGEIDEILIKEIPEFSYVTVIHLRLSNLKVLLKKDNIIGLVRRENPDIIISSLWASYCIGNEYKLKNPDVKYFIFIHSTKFFHVLDRYFSVKAIEIADKVFTDSLATQQFVRSLSPNKPSCIISFLTHATPKYVHRSFNKNEIKLLFLGSISKVKNLPLVIDLLDFMNKKGYNMTLDIYGNNKNARKCVNQKILKSPFSNKYKIKGSVLPQHRFSLFAKYDFYIQLSKFEGMAMSVAEAMQNGLPCIVSPVGEIPNYSKDMESAIFINSIGNKLKESDTEKLESVIQNITLYRTISRNCHNNFYNKNTFSTSLVNAVIESI